MEDKKEPLLPKEIKHFNKGNPEGISHREIARRLNMTRGEVWYLEESALKKIRDFIIKNNLSSKLLDFID